MSDKGKGSGSGDRPEVDARKVNEASGSWGHFFQNIGMLLLRPTAAWDDICKTKEDLSKVLWPHVLVLLLARGVADFFGNLIRGESLAVAMGQMVSSVLAWFVLIWLFALAAASIAGSRGGELTDSFRFSGYALTPLFVVGILAVVPVPYVSRIADLVVMPYAFYVLAVGTVPMLRIPSDKAPGAVGLLAGTMLILWALLPTLLGEVLKMLQK